MKKIVVCITGIIIGIVLTLSINIIGASISSSGVMYNSKTLNTVLDDLYSKITEINSTGDAVSNQILNGKTALVKGTKVTGTMANKAGTTTSSTTVTESGNNALITIPTNGYYSTSSKISVPIETIKNNVSGINSIIATSYNTYGYTTNGNVVISKPSNFKSSTYTLLIYKSEDYRVSENFNITGATLIKKLSSDRVLTYYNQIYELYKVTGQSVTFSFYHNVNAGIAYLLIDKEFNDMEIANDSVTYSSSTKNNLFVSCIMSDNRGNTFIGLDSKNYLVHLNSGRNSVAYSNYYANLFIVYSLLEGGNASVQSYGGNQSYKVLSLSN